MCAPSLSVACLLQPLCIHVAYIIPRLIRASLFFFESVCSFEGIGCNARFARACMIDFRLCHIILCRYNGCVIYMVSSFAPILQITKISAAFISFFKVFDRPCNSCLPVYGVSVVDGIFHGFNNNNNRVVN